MRVLFCGGSEKAGSWIMRGQQIAGQDKDWLAISDPTDEHIEQADLVVVVKRFNAKLLNKIKAHKKKLVLDILDFWPQKENVIVPSDLSGAVMLAKKHIARVEPDALIVANAQMESDLRTCAPLVRCIYHHYRLDAFPVKFPGDTIYYDGCEKHAELSIEVMKVFASSLGIKFKIGKPGADAFALFSGRDDNPSWWMARRWKSNVKAANAIAYNLPMICQRENGYLETLPESHAVYFDELEQIPNLIKRIIHPDINHDLINQFHIANAKAQYDSFLKEVL